MLGDLPQAAQNAGQLIRFVLVILFATLILAPVPAWAQTVPTITSISPTSGAPYKTTLITINGSNLGASLNDVKYITYTAGSLGIIGNCIPVTVTPTQITCNTGADIKPNFAVNFVVVTSSGSSDSSSGSATNGAATTQFATTAATVPVVTSLSPSAGPSAGGTTVTITGQGFGSDATSLSGVTICGMSVPATYIRDSQVTFTTPAFATACAAGKVGSGGPALVQVTTTIGPSTDRISTTSKDKVFYTYVTAPLVTSFSPKSGKTAGNTIVNIFGAGLASTSSVTVGGADYKVTIVNDGQISFRTPAGAAGTSVKVILNSVGGKLSVGDFNYVAAPTVSAVSPNVGGATGGDKVTISGSGFTSDGSTQVTFDGSPATNVTVFASGVLFATTPAGTGTAVVYVGTPGGVDSSQRFNYTPTTPTITSITPNSGPKIGGTNVTITGSGFLDAKNVSVGGPVKSFNLVSDTQITATTDAAAAPGPVNVTVSGGSNGMGTGGVFTYNGALPPTTLQIIDTIAGHGESGNSIINSPPAATQARAQQLKYPTGVAVDSKGMIYIADTGNDVVRKVDPKDYSITTIAGTGKQGADSSDGGIKALNQQLFSPTGIAVDRNDNLYIADTGNSVIRRVDIGSGNITTVVKDLGQPVGVAVDSKLNIYSIFTRPKDFLLSVSWRLIKIDSQGNATTFYQGPVAKFVDEISLAIDTSNDFLYVADPNNYDANIIQVDPSGNPKQIKLDYGQVKTTRRIAVASDGSGTLYMARLSSILAVDKSQNLSMFAGDERRAGFGGDGGPATSATLANNIFIRGNLAADKTGKVYIPDVLNNRIRVVSPVPAPQYPVGTNVAMKVALTVTAGPNTYSFADNDCSGIFLYNNPDLGGSKLTVNVANATCQKGSEVVISFGPNGLLKTGNLTGSLGSAVTSFTATYYGDNTWAGPISGTDFNGTKYTGTLTLTVAPDAISNDLSWLTQGGTFSFSTPFNPAINISALGVNTIASSTIQVKGAWQFAPAGDPNTYKGAACGTFNLTQPLKIPANPPLLPFDETISVTGTWSGGLTGKPTDNNLVFTGRFIPTVTVGSSGLTSTSQTLTSLVTLNLPKSLETGGVPAIVPNFDGSITFPVGAGGFTANMPIKFPDPKAPPSVPLTVSASGASAPALTCLNQ